MEKIDNMHQNKVADDELNEVTGGRNFIDIFTAEFRGKAKKPVTLEMRPDEEDDIVLSTLEMRDNPLKKKKDEPKVIKL